MVSYYCCCKLQKYKVFYQNMSTAELCYLGEQGIVTMEARRLYVLSQFKGHSKKKFY